ncbi:DNA-directed DNA polymerase [Tanacetum coccineum]
MTRSTVKSLTKPLDKPEREFQRLRRAALRSHQNESLAIAKRNLFDDDASSFNNTGLKLPTPSKTLHEHSHPISSGSHEADECEQNNPSEQVCLSRGDIYNDPSLLRFYQNDDTSPWGNNKHKEKEEDGPEWIVRSKFEDELANFMLEKKSHTKGIGDMLVQHRKELLKKQKKDDEDERLLLIFKQIHINLPFLEAVIHMPKGAKVLKDLLSHKEKLEKVVSSVKLSEECSTIIQRSLPQKEGDPSSFTLPWISKLKPTKMSIQLADRSIKYPIEVCINLLVKVSKFIFLVDFVVLEMDEDELVLIILGRPGWPFLATTRAVINIHEGKLSLRVRSETITFNIKKYMKSKHSRDDYLYCADHTVKMVQEQWVNIVNHEGKWTEEEEEEDSNKALAVSFYPRT